VPGPSVSSSSLVMMFIASRHSAAKRTITVAWFFRGSGRPVTATSAWRKKGIKENDNETLFYPGMMIHPNKTKLCLYSQQSPIVSTLKTPLGSGRSEEWNY